MQDFRYYRRIESFDLRVIVQPCRPDHFVLAEPVTLYMWYQ